MTPATSADLRAYLDAHGIDGPPTDAVDGQQLVAETNIVGGVNVVCIGVDFDGCRVVLAPGASDWWPISTITRHAPLPDPLGLLACAEAAQAELDEVYGGGAVPILAPIPMILFCPRCGAQHIDAPDPELGWTNPPHRSHLCAGCGLVWRPADIATTGVAAIQTHGRADSPPDSGWFSYLNRMTIIAGDARCEAVRLRARLAEVEAQAAAMRAALRAERGATAALIESGRLGPDEIESERAWMEVFDAAIHDDAGRALLDEVERLRVLVRGLATCCACGGVEACASGCAEGEGHARREQARAALDRP